MENVELLAPAGSLEILKAAVYSGADAVYIGGKNFGARAFANNFSHEEVIEAVNFCHAYGVRLYITMNTLLNEAELNQAMQEVDFYYHKQVDALIIQDLGLYYRVSNEYPDFEIHASTQMHVHNLSGVKTCARLGFKRVVLARESSKDLIEQACKEDIEIEVFVHGAICVSYSGQCLLSSQMKSRSGNKGVCAQCCRLPYEMVDQRGNTLNSDAYILSPKDMNLLKHIPELIKSGVKSFKIEGRMKKKAYVAYVTSLYRKAIDDYYKGEEFVYTKEMDKHLRSLFNRDFTDDYFLDNPSNKLFFSQKRPNHQGTYLGKIIDKKQSDCYIKLEDDIHQFDGIKVLNQNDDGCMINYLYLNNNLVNSAHSGDTIKLQLNFPFSVGQEVVKTSDYEFESQFDRLNNYQRLGINLDVSAKINQKLMISIKYQDIQFVVRSKDVLSKAKTAPSNQEAIYKQLNKLKNTPYYINSISYDLDEVFIPNGILNELRREFVTILDQKIISSFKRKTPKRDIPYQELINKKIGDLYQRKKDIFDTDNHYLMTPVINSESSYPNVNNIVISEIGGLLNEASHKLAYYTLNIYNSYSLEFIRKLGFEAVILSSELNEKLCNDLYEAYLKRTNDKFAPHIFTSGKRALMYLKKDPFYELGKEDIKLKIADNQYVVSKKDNHVEIIEENFNNFDSEIYHKYQILND